MSIYLGSELLGGTSHDTVSNAHSLLDYKWTDHKLNEMAWLRADTWSWQSGKVYEAAYNHLVADLSSAELKTETFNGITIAYYVAKDGHKIAYESEIIKVSDIFESLGTAWWYIIDIPNKRFKLPRSTHGDIVEKWNEGSNWYILYADNWIEQGGQASVTNANAWTTVNLLIPMQTTNYFISDSLFSDDAYWANQQPLYVGQRTTTTFLARCNQNTSYVMWEVKGYIAYNVSAESQAQYLYFYVGDYSQSAIEQTAGITSEELASKIDLPDNVAQNNCDFVIDYQRPTAENDYTWYRKYKSGWIEQGGRTTSDGQTVVFTIPMADTEYFVSGMAKELDTGAISSVAYLNKTATGITLYGKRVNAAGFASGAHPVYWEVKGFAA